MKMMIRKMLIAGGIAAGLLVACSGPASAAAEPAASWDAGIAAAIHADAGASAQLPSGQILRVYGDATQINGQSVVSGYGYPHFEFSENAPGSPVFRVLPGPFGYGWQQAPNWSDGTYFWPGTVMVANGSVWVYGQRISGFNPFTVVSDAVARFSASTLTYESMTLLPGTDAWGQPVRTSSGFWMAGTRNVPCSYATDCKAGDLAWVPGGDQAKPSYWHITPDVFPPSLDAGTVISPVRIAGGYAAWTKQADQAGPVIERLTAPAMSGPWTVSGVTISSGAGTYSPELDAAELGAGGQVLLSWADSVSYVLHFAWVSR